MYKPISAACVSILLPVVLFGCTPMNGERETDAETASPTGERLGQALPGDSASLFAPGWISGPFSERDTALAPDGSRLLYSLIAGRDGTLLEWIREGESWRGPQVTSFSGQWPDIEPAFHPDGTRLAFASQRPLPGESEAGDWNLWQIDRTAGGWGTPEPMTGINDEGNEFYPSFTNDGSVLFTARREGGQGGEDLWFAEATAEGWETAIPLGPNVNSPGPEFNAFIAPDRSYVLFSSVRDGDMGGGDLYVSFKDQAGEFLPATSLGPQVNSPKLDYCPFVSPDGKQLFFTSNRSVERPRGGWDHAALKAMLEGPRNGLDSLYWVDFAAVERAAKTPGIPLAETAEP